MSIEYLTPEDWTTLYKKYPNLAGDIALLSHKNELQYLRNELKQNYISPERRAWIVQRIADLTWFETV